MSEDRPNVPELRALLDALPNASEDTYEVPIPGTDIMARTCEADQLGGDFLERFSWETCGALLRVAEVADEMDCLNDCGNGEDRATCANPMCRALAALDFVEVRT